MIRQSFANKGFPRLHLNAHRNKTVVIGDTVVHKTTGNQPKLIPSTQFTAKPQELVQHLRWMGQKFNLNQDMYLCGHPGPLRRQIVLSFAQVCGMEVEYLPISRDTTESDIKQRKEIKGDSVVFYDQAPVRAAIHGRLLILDGIENAERNVLPTLNNLLENREMALEDGRFLMNTELLQHSSDLTGSRIVPVHPDFRVIALGNSVPPYKGRSMDPPLRSRLQARFVDEISTDSLLELHSAKVNALNSQHNGSKKVQTLLTFYESLRSIRTQLINEGVNNSADNLMSSVPVFSADSFGHCLELLAKFPLLPVEKALFHCIPIQTNNIESLIANRVRPSVSHLFKDLHTQSVEIAGKEAQNYKLSSMTTVDHASSNDSSFTNNTVDLTFDVQKSNSLIKSLFAGASGGAESSKVSVLSPCGSLLSAQSHNSHAKLSEKVKEIESKLLDSQKSVLCDLLMSHSAGKHICLLGAKGSGKSHLSREFASLLGYKVRAFPLYQDMTQRDLLQRRVTVSSHEQIASPTAGDVAENAGVAVKQNTLMSGWVDSPLIAAARNGDVCILDGIDRIDSHVLHSLRTLLSTGSDNTTSFIDLPNGERLSAADGTIHPSFRIVALGLTPGTSASAVKDARDRWVSSDWGFAYHFLAPPSTANVVDLLHKHIVQSAGRSESQIASDDQVILLLRSLLSALNDNNTLSTAKDLQLSLRQILRLHSLLSTQQAHSTPSVIQAQLAHTLENMLMLQFMSPLTIANYHKATKNIFQNSGSSAFSSGKKVTSAPVAAAKTLSITKTDKLLTIGDTSMPRKLPGTHPEKVPNPLFYANQAHHATLEGLMQTLNAGEKALLLIGNQGVGKNKLVDRLLHLLNAEREYIQLHRDTTVQSLLLIPLLENGRIIYQDSPLLVAARTGRVAVLDEADKAPLEVVCMLKSFVEDGEIVLSDGRRLLSHSRLVAEGSDPLNPPADCVAIHPNFVLFVLANRPGFPFLGNDFFRECGDIFSVHIIDHLDLHSEAALLAQYGGTSVDNATIMKIAKSFAELRSMYGNTATLVEKKDATGRVDRNTKVQQPTSQVLTYPFSPREAVSIVKHLAKYPKDSITEAVENIIAFDTLTPKLKEQVSSVFGKHGLKLTANGAEMNTYWEIVEVAESGTGGSVDAAAQREADRQGAIPKTGTDAPKHGKVDPHNTPHVGGNTWAGGTGGSDTAGLGGRGGPYRLDAGHKVHQVSDEIKAAMSAESKAKAKAMASAAMAERLKEINMGARDFTTYTKYKAKVENQIHQLRSILEELSRRKSERVWLRHQSHGDLDDSKLVDGLSGDKLVFKRRGSPVDHGSAFQNDNNTGDNNGADSKKLFQFVVDVSGSMYRFNGRDQRLERMLESVLLVMETFPTSGDGTQPRPANSNTHADHSENELNIDYSITGHSGDNHDISFVNFNVNKPSNEKERFKLLETMIAHTAYCQSGDNTLESVEWAIKNIEKQSQSMSQEGDGKIDKYILAVSDANFDRYGINVADLAHLMTAARDRGIQVHFILIASFGQEAQDIASQLPPGQAHICHESTDLPAVFRNILTSSGGAFEV